MQEKLDEEKAENQKLRRTMEVLLKSIEVKDVILAENKAKLELKEKKCEETHTEKIKGKNYFKDELGICRFQLSLTQFKDDIANNERKYKIKKLKRDLK